jgi:hypothetical protein
MTFEVHQHRRNRAYAITVARYFIVQTPIDADCAD